MGIEIERKYLVKNNLWQREIAKSTEIIQAYLSQVPERTVRVRIKNNDAFLTIKGITRDSMRKEYEYNIPRAEAEELLQMCIPYPIKKIRHEVIRGKHTWEIDVFSAHNQDLILAEIELDSVDEEYELPEWIGQEVTSDPRYYNSNLSKHPYSEWK